jgi:hypothetical protein
LENSLRRCRRCSRLPISFVSKCTDRRMNLKS